MCSRNLRLSHYRSRLMPRHRNRLTHNLNRDTWLRRAMSISLPNSIRTAKNISNDKTEPIIIMISIARAKFALFTFWLK